MSDLDDKIKEVDMSGNRQKWTIRAKTLIVGGSQGDYGLKINHQGLWTGKTDYNSAPTKIGLDGTTSMSGGSFTTLSATTIVPATSSGLTIAATASEKLGLWGAAPSTQPAAVADSTVDLTSVSTQLNSLLAKLRTIGIIHN